MIHDIIEGAANWRAEDMLGRTDWIHDFTAEELAELDAALAAVHRRGLGIEDVTSAAQFPLERVAEQIDRARWMLEEGPGLFHFRGIDTTRYSKDDLRLMYWGIGRHLGTAVSQSMRGDLLGDVRDLGVDINSPQGRGYTSNAQLSYHTDSADVVGLMVLRTAKSGGLSMIGSSVAIHNEIARARPDLLEVLYQPFPWSWQGQEPPGSKPWYLQPICIVHNGKKGVHQKQFSCRYIRAHILNGGQFADAPPLTEKQVEAMDYFDQLACSERFHFSMMFKPGDIQLLNNHVCVHSRTHFEDFPERDRRRHLLRMWLSVPNSRELGPAMATIYRDQGSGAVRGGFPSRSGGHVYETAAPAD